MSYLLPKKLYHVLKWAALVALPAIGTFWNVVAPVWGLPYGYEVLATCSAAGLLVGAMIGVSAATSKAGGLDAIIDGEDAEGR
jgi:hypothetical protein